MEEKGLDTLERIQQAAMEEFSEKGFLGAFSSEDRKERRSDYRGVLRLFFQQRSAVCFFSGTPCRPL